MTGYARAAKLSESNSWSPSFTTPAPETLKSDSRDRGTVRIGREAIAVENDNTIGRSKLGLPLSNVDRVHLFVEQVHWIRRDGPPTGSREPSTAPQGMRRAVAARGRGAVGRCCVKQQAALPSDRGQSGERSCPQLTAHLPERAGEFAGQERSGLLAFWCSPPSDTS
jgi:hypothetical protein